MEQYPYDHQEGPDIGKLNNALNAEMEEGGMTIDEVEDTLLSVAADYDEHETKEVLRTLYRRLDGGSGSIVDSLALTAFHDHHILLRDRRP